MGRIRHSAIIVTGSEKADAELAHKIATEFGLIVTPVIPGRANGYASFMVCPDGSKEGWDTSRNYDVIRHAFVNWLVEPHQVERRGYGAEASYLAQAHFDWVYLDFGGDDDDVVVRDHVDNDDRKEQLDFS